MEQPDQLSAVSSRPWFVVIYQTSTFDAQQEIVLRLASFARDGLQVLAASSGPDHFIVAEGASSDDRRLLRRVVTAVDRSAREVQTASPWPGLRHLDSDPAVVAPH